MGLEAKTESEMKRVNRYFKSISTKWHEGSKTKKVIGHVK